MNTILFSKLNSLLIKHRRLVFEGSTHSQDCHTRALYRLKRTKTAQELFRINAENQNYRISERLLRSWA